MYVCAHYNFTFIARKYRYVGENNDKALEKKRIIIRKYPRKHYVEQGNMKAKNEGEIL
jgi:hypothetical protein